MTPTPEEKLWLKDYLYEAFTYRETFNEAYDHILLALEHKERKQFFESNVTEIIDEDFGGSTNMLNMELEYKTTINQAFKAVYFQTLFGWLKMPLLPYTAVIFAAMLSILLIFYKSKITAAVLIFSILASIIIQLTFLILRSFKAKPSVKDSAFKWLIWGFYLVNNWIIEPVLGLLGNLLTLALYQKTAKAYPNNPVGYTIGALCLTLMVIHILSLIKIHRDEFKTQMITAR